MEITFVRTSGNPDRIYVRRSSGDEASWAFPSYGDGLPHDLVHLVVEAAFGLRRGLWGLVDAGADMARINAEANRRGGKDKYRALGPDQHEILLSEALAAAVSVGQSAGTAAAANIGMWETEEHRLEHVLSACRSLGFEPAVPVTRERLDEVLAALDQLRERWLRLTASASLPEGERPQTKPGSLRFRLEPGVAGVAQLLG